MIYGDIIRLDGALFKVVGGCMQNKEECYELKPLVANIVYLANYVDKNCEIVKENPIGVPIDFN